MEAAYIRPVVCGYIRPLFGVNYHEQQIIEICIMYIPAIGVNHFERQIIEDVIRKSKNDKVIIEKTLFQKQFTVMQNIEMIMDFCEEYLYPNRKNQNKLPKTIDVYFDHVNSNWTATCTQNAATMNRKFATK